MNPFNSGPFTYRPVERFTLNKQPRIRWALAYDGEELGEAVTDASSGRADVAEALGEARADWILRMRKQHSPDRIYLVDCETDEASASFYSFGVPDMTPGIINDSSKYWLRSADRLSSRAVTLSEYGQIVRKHAAQANAWIAGLLPGDTLSLDPAEWRAPSSWEIRHIVGEGSLTGITGAEAAHLVGVSPQNFRKYTAADGASTHQKMGFAMWHFLLNRLGIA